MALAEARLRRQRGEAAPLRRARHTRARSWDRQRRVIARIEHGPKGSQPAASWSPTLAGDGRDLYERRLLRPCSRWRTASRNSSSSSSPTAPRATDGRRPTSSACCSPASPTSPARRDPPPRPRRHRDGPRYQCATIRLKLLKVGAVITRNTRRVRFHHVLRLPRAGPLPPGRRPAETRITPHSQHSPVQAIDAGNPTGNAGPRLETARKSR